MLRYRMKYENSEDPERIRLQSTKEKTHNVKIQRHQQAWISGDDSDHSAYTDSKPD